MSYILCKLTNSGYLFYKRSIDSTWALCHDGVISQKPLDLGEIISSRHFRELFSEDQLFGIKEGARIRALLFSDSQLEAGLHEKLNIHQGCYGPIEPRSFRTGKSLR